MLNFQQIILRKIFLILTFLFIALGVLVYFWVKDFYIQQTKKSLLNNIQIISLTIQNGENLDELAKKIKNKLGLRLTLVSLDGKIIAESHQNKNEMTNHTNRQEIQASNYKSFSYIIRYSDTLDKDFLYVAKRYDTKNIHMYIRLSKEIENINEDIILLGEEILAILTIFFIFLFFMTYKISQHVENEVKHIVTFLSSMTKKKKMTYISSTFSLEFSKITSLLTKVSLILIKKEKQKTKFTAKLQQSNKQKDDIISAISHEFKNPIAVINGYSQTLLEDPDISSIIRQKFLTKIHKNGTKLSDLIDTLRLSIKLDSGQQKLNFKMVNLHDLASETIENLSINYPKRKTILKGKKDIQIKGDEALLSVVIINLIENAFKYSEDEVIINCDTNSLDIIDTGIGISASNLEQITNKFYRVNENSWNNSLGLGLFIVRNILNLHHFTLKIQSKENEGSTFSVKF